MVSELLGSWGDNELSPECLDGAQEYLQPDGISIPQSYTSYLAPITTAKLWNGACEAFPGDRLKGLETPYVVRLHSFSELSLPQPLFTFVHPNTDHPIDNTRYKEITTTQQHSLNSLNRFGTLSFQSPSDQCIHGFSGTFDSVLFRDTIISIAPHVCFLNLIMSQLIVLELFERNVQLVSAFYSISYTCLSTSRGKNYSSCLEMC